MKIFSEILLGIQNLRTTAHVTLLFTRPIFPNSLGIQLEHEERLSLYSLTMAIFSVSGAEVRLHTEQPVHFSLGTLPQNPRYSHNPTAVRFLGLSLDRPPPPHQVPYDLFFNLCNCVPFSKYILMLLILHKIFLSDFPRTHPNFDNYLLFSPGT